MKEKENTKNKEALAIVRRQLGSVENSVTARPSIDAS
jgi:hypothetical protein